MEKGITKGKNEIMLVDESVITDKIYVVKM